MRSRLLLLLLPAALAGCAGGGRPTTYLTLEPSPPAGGPASASSGPALAVAEVAMPPGLDRAEFETATGGATLRAEGTERWVGPLDQLARLALARDLALRLTGADVLMPGDPVPPGGARQVRVVVAEFSSDASGQVTLEADWSILGTDGKAIEKRGSLRTEVAGGRGAAAEAATMGRALGRLADAVAQALSRAGPGPT